MTAALGPICLIMALAMLPGLHASESYEVILTDVPGGTATCPAGYQPLTSSWEACRDAAISLGFSGDAVAHVDYQATNCGLWGTSRPQGCFLTVDNGRFHFNCGAGGNHVAGDQMVCRPPSSPPAGPPPPPPPSPPLWFDAAAHCSTAQMQSFGWTVDCGGAECTGGHYQVPECAGGHYHFWVGCASARRNPDHTFS